MQTIRRPSTAQILKAAGTKSLLVTNLKNIEYLTGIAMSAGFLLVDGKAMELFADSRYLAKAMKSVRKGVTVRNLAEFEKRLKALRRIGIESDSVTIAREARWKKKFKNTKFIHTSGVIEEFRRRKSLDELQKIIRACIITKSVLLIIPKLLKTGITERDLAWEIDTQCRKRGAEGMAFETIVAFGENSASPHHHPEKRKLKKGDLVQIDMGAKVDAYASDFSRVYFFGTVPHASQKKAYKALMQAQRAAIKKVKAGVSNHGLDLIARKVLKTYGYDKEFSHALGHGLGLDIHEGVTLSKRAPLQKLLKNEVITIEPGLYFDGKWGMRIEDTVIV